MTINTFTHAQEYSMTTKTIPPFDSYPDNAYIRAAQLVRSPKHPERAVPLPFGWSTLLRRVHAGTFPQPVKLSTMVTGWKVGDVRAWIAALSGVALDPQPVAGSAA